jgi:hypothetical protein
VQPSSTQPTKPTTTAASAPKPSIPTTQAAQPTTQAQAQPQQVTPAQLPPVTQSAPASSPELDDAREKFAVLSGKAAATEQLLGKIKADLEAKGLNIRAETLSRMTSMKLNLSLAQENIARGNAEAALRNLSIADALSSRVNKELGR